MLSPDIWAPYLEFLKQSDMKQDTTPPPPPPKKKKKTSANTNLGGGGAGTYCTLPGSATVTALEYMYSQINMMHSI